MAAGTRNPASRPRRSVGEWTSAVEEQSLGHPRGLLKVARANSRAAADDSAFLARLATEIALTRGPELTLAYRNVISVQAGFRKQKRNGRRRVRGEPCVVFIVKTKRQLAPDNPQCLPRWLLTYSQWNGERRLFAVGTDVQAASEFSHVRAHAASGVWAHNAPYPPANGSFACLVRLDTTSRSDLCLLSALHVFTPFPDGESLQVTGGLDVLPLGAAGTQEAAPLLSVTLPVGGVLRSDQREERPSFDVQLALVDPAAGIGSRVALRRFHPQRPFVRSMQELLLLDKSKWFHLLPPANNVNGPGRGPLRMTLATFPPRALPIAYQFAGKPYVVERDVYHEELLGFECMDAVARPIPGDSGSPVVARWSDGTMTLVGMHIAGDDSCQSWAIPAWRLMDADNWWQFPSGMRLTPVDA